MCFESLVRIFSYPARIGLACLALTACGAATQTPASSGSQLASAEWVESLGDTHRYRVDTSRGHHYQLEQWLVLYPLSAQAGDADAIGYGQVRYSGEHTVFVDVKLPIAEPPRRLRAGPMP